MPAARYSLSRVVSGVFHVSAPPGVSIHRVDFAEPLAAPPSVAVTAGLVNSLGQVFFGVNGIYKTYFEVTVRNNQSATAEYNVHWIAVVP